MRIRQDVWTLTRSEGDWPAVLEAYERAVGLLRALDPPGTGRPTNPRGWRYLAAIHGRAADTGGADTSDPLWSTCQHGSWYFLPWHRMYLRAFELIVQDILEDDDWSLPYWYTLDPGDLSTAVLPPAFRDTRSGNNLRTESRSMAMNAGLPLPNAALLAPTVVDAFAAGTFSTPAGTSTFGGGERSTPSFSGEEVGLIEGAPHGAVHTFVGNDIAANGATIRRGWMGSFYTAGLDPIFWLHHANIDRLWQAWLEQGHQIPSDDSAWADTTFTFPAADSGNVTWRIGDVLDPDKLGYVYESTAAPTGVAPPEPLPVDVGPGLGLGEAAMPEPLPPQVLGATLDVPLASTDPVDVDLAEPADLGLGLGVGDDPGAGRVFLRVERVTGTAAAPVYQVHINLPPGEAPDERPDLRAGLMSTFGLAEASEDDGVHDGTGLTAVFDITPVRDALEQQGRWDPTRLQVTFSPVGADAEPPDDADEPPPPTDVRAGQVMVVGT